MTKLDPVAGSWIVAIALVINTSSQAFLFAVLPTVGRGIGLSPIQTGAVLGLGALLGMFAAPLWGFASERFGRRPVLLATIVGVAITPLAWAVALGGLADSPSDRCDLHSPPRRAVRTGRVRCRAHSDGAGLLRRRDDR